MFPCSYETQHLLHSFHRVLQYPWRLPCTHWKFPSCGTECPPFFFMFTSFHSDGIVDSKLKKSVLQHKWLSHCLGCPQFVLKCLYLVHHHFLSSTVQEGNRPCSWGPATHWEFLLFGYALAQHWESSKRHSSAWNPHCSGSATQPSELCWNSMRYECGSVPRNRRRLH